MSELWIPSDMVSRPTPAFSGAAGDIHRKRDERWHATKPKIAPSPQAAPAASTARNVRPLIGTGLRIDLHFNRHYIKVNLKVTLHYFFFAQFLHGRDLSNTLLSRHQTCYAAQGLVPFLRKGVIPYMYESLLVSPNAQYLVIQ